MEKAILVVSTQEVFHAVDALQKFRAKLLMTVMRLTIS
jgi:hypothetical protein